MEVLVPTIVEIFDFSPEYRADFKRLNAEWMAHFFGKNSNDHLDNPEGAIIENGGFILLARFGDAIVGTCAVLKASNKVFEIADLAVTPAFRGKGIGKQLLIEAVDRTRQHNARQIVLLTSSRLKISVELFKTFGFRETGHDEELSIFDNSDMKMVLSLK